MYVRATDITKSGEALNICSIKGTLEHWLITVI